MNKKGLSWAKVVGLIIAAVVLILLIVFAGKFEDLKEIFKNLFNSFGI